MNYSTELSRKLIRDLAGVYEFPICKMLYDTSLQGDRHAPGTGPIPRREALTGNPVSPSLDGAMVLSGHSAAMPTPCNSHRPNTESMRCSCKAPLCSNCGWCAATCGCYDGRALEVELRKRRIPDAREVDLERQSGCFDE